MSCERERGAGKLKALLWLLILAAFGYWAYKAVPAYVSNYELEDYMKTEARFAAVNRTPPEEVRNKVLRKVQELGIPAQWDDIRVQSGPDTVTITVDYRVLIDLVVYKYEIHFQPKADNRSV